MKKDNCQTPPRVAALDHLVLTVSDMAATMDFYGSVLGMTPATFRIADGSSGHALTFGSQKINLHPAATPFEPGAAHPGPGTADLCFLTDTSLAAWQAHLTALGVAVEEGPVRRDGTDPVDLCS